MDINVPYETAKSQGRILEETILNGWPLSRRKVAFSETKLPPQRIRPVFKRLTARSMWGSCSSSIQSGNAKNTNMQQYSNLALQNSLTKSLWSHKFSSQIRYLADFSRFRSRQGFVEFYCDLRVGLPKSWRMGFWRISICDHEALAVEKPHQYIVRLGSTKKEATSSLHHWRHGATMMQPHSRTQTWIS